MNLLNMMSSPWAILPTHLENFQYALNSHLNGPFLDLKNIESRILGDKPFNVDSLAPKSYEVMNGTAVIRIQGPISKNPDIFDRVILGMTSSQKIKQSFTEALEDEDVENILLYIDSPGGTVAGTQELEQTISQTCGKKPVIAYTDGMMASAAYWIGSAADKLYISGDTTQVGSIGVIQVHYETSEMDKKAGINVTEFIAGKYKNAASPNKPLTEEGKEYIQSKIDYLYTVFVKGVAKNRNVSPEQVASAMADGRIFVGKQAIKAGLVDGVASFDRLIGNKTKNSGTKAEGEGFLGGLDPENGSNVLYGQPGVVLPAFTDNKLKTQEGVMDINTIKSEHPAIFDEIKGLGREEASLELKDKLAEARAEGMTAENDRIKGIKALSIPGHEALIEEMILDGKTTPADAAIRIIQAEAKQKNAALENLRTDMSAVEGAVPPEATPADDKSKPVEERAQDQWDADPALKAEFSSFSSYLAYFKNAEAGSIRIHGGKK